MLFDTTYYWLSMLKVYAAITALVFVFPAIMWRDFLRRKRFAYRFLFCVITQNAYCISLVLLLGFLDVCNPYTVFAGLALQYFFVRWKFHNDKPLEEQGTGRRRLQKALTSREYRRGSVKYLWRMAKSSLESLRRWPLWRYLARNWFPFLLLLAALCYNAYFLTHNVNIYHSYQFSDIPVHQSWIYELEYGTLFSAGIYPFGMHSMIYVVRVLTGLNLREILLYYGSYQTLLLMLAMYCVARRIFTGRYVAFLPVVLFSLLLNNGRYAASLPQECGMFATMTLAYFMLEFLHSKREPHSLKTDTPVKRFFRINQYFFRRYLTTEILLVMLSVALVIQYHFYTAIAAIILVVGFGVGYLPKLIHKQYWVPLVTAGVLGAVIAVLPMAACLAKGIPFQESMAWATSVIKGEQWQGSESDYLSLLEQAKTDEENAAQAEQDAQQQAQEADAEAPQGLSGRLSKLYNALLHFGQDLLYGVNSSYLMLGCMAVGLIAALFFAFFRKTRSVSSDYIVLIVYVLIIAIMGRAQELGIINIIAESRASVFIQPFLFLLYTVPVDALLRVFFRISSPIVHKMLSALALTVCVLAGVSIVHAGWFHQYFDVNLAYYNEPVYVIKDIKEQFPTYSYIVVSPTEEYYEVVPDYHTELSEFVNIIDGQQEAYTFPSDYVFFFIEKHVLQDYYLGSIDVSPELAKQDFVFLRSSQDYYFQREILESKAYYWAQKCLELYPNNFSVYFEDDIYVVYLLKQNPYYPYDLRVDYRSSLPAAEPAVQ